MSQFVAESEVEVKESSIEEKTSSRNEYEEYCIAFEQKMKEMIVKSQISHRVEV